MSDATTDPHFVNTISFTVLCDILYTTAMTYCEANKAPRDMAITALDYVAARLVVEGPDA